MWNPYSVRSRFAHWTDRFAHRDLLKLPDSWVFRVPTHAPLSNMQASQIHTAMAYHFES